ncbi:terminase large subunit [Echinicola strongylocentroti]|uniref:Terminase large subunit n=1 Tax=Echinicola strongylocentroti TaxID=1795355 RepID=A0A2Z4IMU9_9BACT|nr:terminase TerL endonuclease subunit [Echinicola strongylocentroti]AWW32164.1 terminase large subunit [Echinicola strongylocentroti]
MQAVDQYISEVQSGEIVTCKWVKLAVERHLDDLENGGERGLVFDPSAGERAIKFFSFLKHYKGSYAGKPFELLPWQQFIIFVLYGWKLTSGERRFRYAYVEVSRKNGKTTFASGLSLYSLIMDREDGAEVYTSATKRDQAKIAFNDAKAMTEKSPHLAKYIDVYQHNLHVLATHSKLEPLSSDQNTLDGLNPHFALVDEYHAHKDDGLYNVLKSGMGSRTQPMLFTITTAGFNKMGPCYALRKTCTEILEGVKQDDSQFAIIFTLDKDDDYTDEKVWIKANPSLNHSISIQWLRQEVIQAKNNPTQLVNLLTKNFNVWTDASEVWIEDKRWLECAGEIDQNDLEYDPAYGGLDLAAVRDINAFSLVFPVETVGKYMTLTWYWIPKETMMERINRDGVRYDLWVEEGWIIETEGNVTDYRKIKQDIMDLCERFNVEKIAFDRWNSSQLIIELTEEGLEMYPYGQGFASMSQPTKTLETWIMSQDIVHDSNPVTRWMLGNVELMRDAAGNIKPDKAKSQEKIDGIVSIIMAIGVMLADGADMANTGPSKYDKEEGGLISI